MSHRFLFFLTRLESALDAHNFVDECLDLFGLDNRPLPDLGQMLVIVSDVTLDFLGQIVDGEKVASGEDMLGEDTEPDFNRIEPATVLGRIDEADAMLGVTQIGLSGLHTLENARFAFFT